MVRHIVCWKLKESAEGHTKAENAGLIKEKLEALVGVIDEIKELRVGINENGGEYDVLLETTFESMDALKAYDAHEAHQAVREFVRSVVESRVAVDYTI